LSGLFYARSTGKGWGFSGAILGQDFSDWGNFGAKISGE
jgi:hypothetical protein